MKNPVLLLALTGALALSGGAAAQPVGDPYVGREFALKVCAECHAVLPEDGSSPNTEAPTFTTIANTPGMSDIALASWFQTPHKSMPNFMLKADERENVIAYITSLRSANE